MPIARYELPDGRIARFEVPDGTTPEQAQSLMGSFDFSQIEQPKPQNPDDQGVFASYVQGWNENVPFGNRLTAGAAALAHYPIAKLSGSKIGLEDLYGVARDRQKATEAAHPDAHSAGLASGILAQLPIAFGAAKGAANTTPVIGKIADVAQGASAKAGNYISGGATTAGKMARGASVAAPTSAVYAYGGSDREGVADPERLMEAASAFGMGGLVGGAVPGAAAAGNALINKAKTGLIPLIDENTAQLAGRAQELGVPLRIDQIAPGRVRSNLQKISQEIPFSGADAFEANQGKAWMQALAKTIGQETDDLGPQTINRFLDESSKKFNGALTDKIVTFGDDGMQAIREVAQKAEADVTGDIADLVKKNVDKVLSDIGRGEVKGDKISSLRSDLVKRLPKVDSKARPYIAEIVDAIDSAVEKSVPESTETLRQVRRHWRNFKTLEPLLEKSTDGVINPTQLINRVAQSPYIKASRSGVGSDDLVDLARIGKEFLAKKGGSDTMPKLAAAGGYGGGILSLLTAPAATMQAVPAVGAGLAANRAFQSGYNTNQKLIGKAIAAKGGKAAQKQIENNAMRLIPPGLLAAISGEQ